MEQVKKHTIFIGKQFLHTSSPGNIIQYKLACYRLELHGTFLNYIAHFTQYVENTHFNRCINIYRQLYFDRCLAKISFMCASSNHNWYINICFLPYT